MNFSLFNKFEYNILFIKNMRQTISTIYVSVYYGLLIGDIIHGTTPKPAYNYSYWVKK